ncbi:MAG: hypothetical protein ACKVHR_09740 [Pirellulales bacterium]|jgi:hypothetical protein
MKTPICEVFQAQLAVRFNDEVLTDEILADEKKATHGFYDVNGQLVQCDVS